MIDGHALLYRGYYAFLNRPMFSSNGVDTSAIYGFTKTVFELILKERPSHLFVAFDPGGKTFRNDMYPLYKANRPETPQVIKDSLPVVKEILQACNIPVIVKENVEADDVIGTLAKRAEQLGFEVIMVTPDKDYGQLVSPHIKMYRPHSQGEGWDIMGVKEVCDKYGIYTPEQVTDILAIWGDASDNVPGVRGIGPVGAGKIIGQYGSVENMLDHVGEMTLRMQERINACKDALVLSKDLVTIRTHLDIPWDVDSCRISCANMERLQALFLTYDFHSLMRLLPRLESLFCSGSAQPETKETAQPELFLGQVAPAPAPTQDADAGTGIATLPPHITYVPEDAAAWINAPIASYVSIDDPEATAALMDKALREGGLNLAYASLTHQLAVYVGHAFYAGPLPAFKPLLENEQLAKRGFRLKDLYTELLHYDITLKGYLLDAELMHYLINPERSHAPQDLCMSYLNFMMPEGIGSQPPMQDLFGDVTAQAHPLDNLRPAFREARLVYFLVPLLVRQLVKDNLLPLYQDVEMPLMRVLSLMEYEGIRVDVAMLQEYGYQLASQAAAIEKQVRDYAGNPALNISSPKQLGVVLYEHLQLDPRVTKGKKYATDEETLTALADRHPIVSLILEYRSLRKLLSSYIESIPQLVDPRTGRIHTTFNQTVTATGRLSSQKPNLQNIPIREERGRMLRKAFLPHTPQHLLLSADYSQIELRLMAHCSGDPDFIAAFNAEEDIHRATAAKIYHCTLEEVTPEQRSRAKTANFGILYGISAFGLSGRLNIPRAEAKQLIDDYFAHYPTVKKYIDDTVEQARQKGYVETLFHRRRYIPEIHAANAMVRALAQRNAINAPIQGTAADIIKIAMVRIEQAMDRQGLRSRMLVQVHDELVFDVPPEERDIMLDLVTQTMEHAATLSVPLKVSVGFGSNWLEAH